MTLKDLVDSLKTIADCTGEKSLVKKKMVFKNLIADSDGLVLRFFDASYRAKLNVNIATCLKVLDSLDPYQDLELDQFFKLQSDLIDCEGKDSVLKKTIILKQIFSCVGSNIDILLDYYSKSMFKIGLSEKIAFNCLIQDSRKKELLIESFQRGTSLYELYKNPENPSFKVNNCILKPMLATNTTLKEDVLYGVELKLDGVRLLLKKQHGSYTCWTRSGLFLDALKVIQLLPKSHQSAILSLKQDFILDGQLWIPNKTAGEGFRQIMPIIKSKKPLALKAYYSCFDVLYYKTSLIEKSYLERRKILESLGVAIVKKRLIRGRNVSKLLSELNDNVYQGVILKVLAGVYEPGKRSNNWIKIKPLCDSIDVLVTNAQKGTGKYKNLYASFDISVLNEGSLVSIGQVGSGFKEKDLVALSKSFDEKKRIILEVRAEAFTVGTALRFPRFIRVRQDKIEPNTLDQVKKIFGIGKSQSVN